MKQNYQKPNYLIEEIKLEDIVLTSVGTNVSELAGTDEVKDIIYW